MVVVGGWGGGQSQLTERKKQLTEMFKLKSFSVN